MRKSTTMVNGVECGLGLRLESPESEPPDPSIHASETPGGRVLVTLKTRPTYVCPLGHKSEETSLQERTHGVTVYRKSRGNGETWHVCSNCSSWPDDDFIDQTTVPTTGEMCNECQAKRRAANGL